MSKFYSTAIICSFFILVSCGYRLGEQEGVARLSETSLSIPYVEYDIDGQLTDELVKVFAASGVFNYSPSHGVLELNVKIISQNNECLGWRYNRNPEGKRNKDLIATEGRRYIQAEVTLVDTLNDEILLEPTIVEANLDFDYYEPDSLRDLSFVNDAGIRQTSIKFSLGQLDSTEGAYDAAWTPLSQQLAKKILDLILHASYY